MTKARSVILVPAICVVLMMSAAAPPVWAATGSVLAEFWSQELTSPKQQGWTHDGNCLSEACPGTHVSPPNPDPINYPCYYQGWGDYNFNFESDNNCKPSIGCSCIFSTGCIGFNEHYNSPPKLIIDGNGICTFTEWVVFDNGPRYSPNPEMYIPDSDIDESPPFGAQGFLNAPLYPTLRISTGDGNLVPDSLPIARDEFGNPTGPTNNRNRGRVRIYNSFNLSPEVHAVTLVCKAAAGPRPGENEFVRVQVFNRWFTFGVDGDLSHVGTTYGRFTYGHNVSGNFAGYAFGPDDKVLVAQPMPGGTADGEFFTLRVIMRDDGTFDAHLNEKIESPFLGSVGLAEPGPNEISLTPREGDDTMWIDYIHLLEGEVRPSCPEMVFDFNRNGWVFDSINIGFDDEDYAVFFASATGPVDANGSWASLSPDCQCMDVTQDNSLDMEDFAILQRSPRVTRCTPVSLQNGGFEIGDSTPGNTSIATGWTSYTRGNNQRVVPSIQTATPAEGLQYQQIQTSYYPVGSGAGVYQVVTGCTIGHTYRIQGWFRTNSKSNCRATVKCDPYGGTSYSNAIDLIPAATTRGDSWVHFNGAVTAQGPSITFFLDGQTLVYTAGSEGKAAAFDGLVITGCTFDPDVLW